LLTRLRVSGFKNLVDVDVRFGPFTCIAGANGVGKSNLFDAIKFLSALSDRPLMDAALSVRDEGGRSGDVKSLFHRVGDHYSTEMSFEAEMIVPRRGVDDLGQEVGASITFLRYALTLTYKAESGARSLGALELTKEELSHIKLGDARKHLLFPHRGAWRTSAVMGGRRVPYFISTVNESGSRIIKIHQDGGSSGRPRSLLANTLPRTALSAANAAESPTTTLARREMQSWRLLQLEPSSLREPDSFTAPNRLGADGSHLAASLYHLAGVGSHQADDTLVREEAAKGVYSRVANRLSELIDDVRDVWVDRDERRELLTLWVSGLDGTAHPGRALSDGTLRFLALAVLELDPEATGLLCFEEPENGIHPERIPAMLRLLRDIAVNVDDKVGLENPLRQVIINTHSPAVVLQVPDDSLLIAELKEMVQQRERFRGVSFECLPDTWRASGADASSVPRGRLLAYLNPVLAEASCNEAGRDLDSSALPPSSKTRSRRVVDRDDLQLDLDYEDESRA
jgi:predicted ATPase